MFKLIDKVVGLRVSPEEELEGLDVTEHAGTAYPDFEVAAYGGMSTVGSEGISQSTASGVKMDKLVST